MDGPVEPASLAALVRARLLADAGVAAVLGDRVFARPLAREPDPDATPGAFDAADGGVLTAAAVLPGGTAPDPRRGAPDRAVLAGVEVWLWAPAAPDGRAVVADAQDRVHRCLHGAVVRVGGDAPARLALGPFGDGRPTEDPAFRRAVTARSAYLATRVRS